MESKTVTGITKFTNLKTGRESLSKICWCREPYSLGSSVLLQFWVTGFTYRSSIPSQAPSMFYLSDFMPRDFVTISFQPLQISPGNSYAGTSSPETHGSDGYLLGCSSFRKRILRYRFIGAYWKRPGCPSSNTFNN